MNIGIPLRSRFYDLRQTVIQNVLASSSSNARIVQAYVYIYRGRCSRCLPITYAGGESVLNRKKRASILITAKTEIGATAAQIELRGVADKR